MRIRATEESDREALVNTLLAAFGTVPEPAAPGMGSWWSAFEMDRSLVAEVNGQVIGTTGAYTFELTLPGPVTAPVAGVTAVGVLPSHRRRGVLTGLMRHQLQELQDRGEFLAVLLASEARIYRRFGYGPATFRQQVSVKRHRANPTASATDGYIDVLQRADCGDTLAAVYDSYRRAQPGAVSRPASWWELGASRPPVARTRRLVALHHDGDGRADGYASYLVGAVDPVTKARVLSVDEVIATNDNAYIALFRYLLEHDLVTDTVFDSLPPHHWFRWRLDDYRAATVLEDHDWLWVRVLDVPRALGARAYRAEGRLVIDVTDEFHKSAAGRFVVTVSDGSATCETTSEAPDLSLDVSDLGSVYLGGIAPSTLVQAGRIQARTSGVVDLADSLFRAERTPHTVTWF